MVKPAKGPFDDPAIARIRVYRTKHGVRWECKGRNGEVTSRGGEPFNVGLLSIKQVKKYMRRRIAVARRQLVLGRIKWDI